MRRNRYWTKFLSAAAAFLCDAPQPAVIQTSGPAGVQLDSDAKRPWYQLVYRAFWSYCGFLHMVDKLRRLDERNHLCIGTLSRAFEARIRLH